MLIVQDVDQIDDIGVGQSFERLDLFVLFNLVEGLVFMLHYFEGHFLSSPLLDCHEHFAVGAFALFDLNFILVHVGLFGFIFDNCI